MLIAEQRASLKKQVITLAALNALDGILTYFGLVLGVISEGNPLLSSFSPFAILALKLLLSLCLFGLIFTPFVFIESHKWRYLFFFTNILYSMILLLHLFWLLLLAAF